MNEDLEKIEKLTYDLAKNISRLHCIYDQFDYIVKKNKWDGMFLVDFSDALMKLSNALAGGVCYSCEDKYIKDDIRELEQNLEAYKSSNGAVA